MKKKMQKWKRFSLSGLMLSAVLVACQVPSSTPEQQTGSLSFRVAFPERPLRIQQIPAQTTQIAIALFEPQSDQPLRFDVLDRKNPRLVIAALSVGNKEVIAVALDANATVLSGDFETAEVKAAQRQQVILELTADWQHRLPLARQNALKQLLQSLQQSGGGSCQALETGAANNAACLPSPAPSTPPPSPNNSPSPSPVASPSPTISPSPVASPSPTPLVSGVGSNSGNDSNGGGSNSGNSGGSNGGGSSGGSSSPNEPDLGTNVTVSDGNPSPPPVAIEGDD